MSNIERDSKEESEVTLPWPQEGFVRLPSIIAPHGPIPVCKSAWWEGVKKGRYPKPVKLGPRTTAWNVKHLRALLKRLAGE
jgi:prophage regulatory protein